MEYDFEMKFKLGPNDAEGDELVELLGEGGCTDAVIGTGQPGRVALSFTREAKSARRAVISALKDVRRVIPKAQLIEISPDFVGLTEVAEQVGVSRQNMRKLMLAYPESFPAPVHEGSAALWHLLPVLQWLENRGGYSITERLLEMAHIAMQVNLAKEAGHIDRPLQREFQALIG